MRLGLLVLLPAVAACAASLAATTTAVTTSAAGTNATTTGTGAASSTSAGTTRGGTTGGATSGGTSGSSTTSGGPPTFVISEYRYEPANLNVPAGTTIYVVNQDTTAHTATSESALGAFDGAAASPGFTFDTGLIQGGATATIVVPADAGSGTVQPFFCSIHDAMMYPANPTITVQ